MVRFTAANRQMRETATDQWRTSASPFRILCIQRMRTPWQNVKSHPTFPPVARSSGPWRHGLASRHPDVPPRTLRQVLLRSPGRTGQGQDRGRDHWGRRQGADQRRSSPRPDRIWRPATLRRKGLPPCCAGTRITGTNCGPFCDPECRASCAQPSVPSVWEAYVRLAVIDLAIRLAAHLHLTRSSPEALEFLGRAPRDDLEDHYLNQKRQPGWPLPGTPGQKKSRC